ncbi:MAG: RES family NAD+ phosphorylase [Chitinophagaceae bacterium]
MIVYRIGRTKFSNDLSGEGAKLHGGRWNNIAIPCVYASESRALALLEFTVNINLHDIPRMLSITSIDIDAEVITKINIADLPGNWADYPAPPSTKDFGSQLLQHAEYPVFQIPSAIIRQEHNFVINPQLISKQNCRIVHIEDFVYDVRIKQ